MILQRKTHGVSLMLALDLCVEVLLYCGSGRPLHKEIQELRNGEQN
jgi:hypothetical protein